MRTANQSTGNLNVAEAGHKWEERLTGAQGTLELLQHQPFRVHALGATTVTIDGVLAMTMVTGMVAILNAGSNDQVKVQPPGDPNAARPKQTITVTIGGATANVQVARMNWINR